MLGATLLCALAFNLTFFVQELFLVIPKALTPGIHATLYHNNHDWTGDNPVVRLLQGTGALADLASGLLFCGLLASWTRPSMTGRLFLFWMAFQGLYQCLSQVVIGAIIPGNDVGMAMGYLGFSAGEKWAAALIALCAMTAAGVWLMRMLIQRIATSAETASASARLRFVFQAVTLPALASVPVLIAFREPRNIVEVVILPLIVMLCGILFVQGSAWFGPVASQIERRSPSLVIPLGALLLVLAFFQLVLRPGVAFS